MIDRFIKFKEPIIIEDDNQGGKTLRKGDIIFRSHVVMTDGRHFIISDAQHGEGFSRIDETFVFPCDEERETTDWTEVGDWSGREVRTEWVVNEMNRS